MEAQQTKAVRCTNCNTQWDAPLPDNATPLTFMHGCQGVGYSVPTPNPLVRLSCAHCGHKAGLEWLGEEPPKATQNNKKATQNVLELDPKQREIEQLRKENKRLQALNDQYEHKISEVERTLSQLKQKYVP